MDKTEQPDQVSADDSLSKLTYKQERFIQEYVRNGGNATRAAISAGYSPDCAKQIGSENLTKPAIREAIATWREEMRSTARVTRDDLLTLLISMLLAAPGDFVDVNPADATSFIGLGLKQYAIKDMQEEVPGKSGRKLSFESKRDLINDLWEKLGFDQAAGAEDKVSILGRLIGVAEKLGRGNASGAGGTTSEGSG